MFIERDNGSTWEKFGPVWPMTPPQSANFPTWVNQGSATCVDNKGAIFLEAGNSSNEQLRARLQAYPTPPFTVDMAFLTNVFPYSSPSITAGLCIRDSVSGKFQCYGVGNTDLHIRGYNYSSYSAASGGVTGWPGSGDNHQLEQNSDLGQVLRRRRDASGDFDFRRWRDLAADGQQLPAPTT